MYAIVEIAGKQYKVQENDKLVVPRLSADVDESVTFDRVLLVSDGDDVQLGTPVVEKAAVTATIVEHFKGDKVLVFRKKRRKRFKVKRGHRQPYTRIEVSGLSLDGNGKASKKSQKSEAKAETKTEAKAASETTAEASSKDEATSSSVSPAKKAAESKSSSKDSTKKTSSTKSASKSKSKSSKKKDDSE